MMNPIEESAEDRRERLGAVTKPLADYSLHPNALRDRERHLRMTDEQRDALRERQNFNASYLRFKAKQIRLTEGWSELDPEKQTALIESWRPLHAAARAETAAASGETQKKSFAENELIRLSQTSSRSHGAQTPASQFSEGHAADSRAQRSLSHEGSPPPPYSFLDPYALHAQTQLLDAVDDSNTASAATDSEFALQESRSPLRRKRSKSQELRGTPITMARSDATDPSAPPTPSDEQVAISSHDQQKVLQGSREEFQQEAASRRASGRHENDESGDPDSRRASADRMDKSVPPKSPRKLLVTPASRKLYRFLFPDDPPEESEKESEEEDEEENNDTIASTPSVQSEQLASESARKIAPANAQRSPAPSQQDKGMDQTRRDSGIEAHTPEPLSATQDPFPPEADTMQDTKIKIIQSIFSNCTEEEARDALVAANGEVPAAATSLIKRAMLQQEKKVEVEAEVQPKQRTLLDEALAAYAKKPKKMQRKGEVVIVLSLEDLDKTFVLRYEDAVSAVPTLEDAQTTAPGNSQAAKHLYILTNPSAGKDVPTLQRREVNILHTDCEEDIYQRANIPPSSAATTPANSAPESGLKVESKADEHDEDILMVTPNSTLKPTDWMQAWETFLCIISHLPHGISQNDMRKALPRMEAVARIAELHEATNSIADAFNGLLTRFIAAQQLWEAIATDPARWVILGTQIQSTLVYKEALKHLVGCYPHWPWSTSKEKVPENIIKIIEAKSKQLYSYQLAVEVELLSITLPTMLKSPSGATSSTLVSQYVNSAGYHTLNLFRDWMSNHISHLHTGDINIKTFYQAQKLCDHSVDGLTLAGFLRTIVAGGDAYIPIDYLLGQYWNRTNFPLKQGDEAHVRLALRALKGKAAEIAKPLTISTLQYEKKEGLEYLTCVEVEDSDVPWAKTTEGGEDGDVEME